MSEENAPEEKTEMPSAGKQIMVMAIIVVGITVVLGGGVWLSMLLKRAPARAVFDRPGNGFSLLRVQPSDAN